MPMKFLKSAAAGKNGFSARFTNGESTSSHDVAAFFQKLEEKGVEDADELMGYVRIGQMIDPTHDWKEISRIARTFA